MSELARRLAQTARVEHSRVIQSRHVARQTTRDVSPIIVLAWRAFALCGVAGALWLVLSHLAAQFAVTVQTALH